MKRGDRFASGRLVSICALAAMLALGACGKPETGVPATETATEAATEATADAPAAGTADEAGLPDGAAPEEAASEAASPSAPVTSATAPAFASALPAGGDFARPEPSIDMLTGKVSPTREAGFAPVPEALATRAGLFGRAEAIDALTRMADAARADGVNLKVVSAFRSFADQKRIWEAKWAGRTKVEGGALPETVPDPAQRALKILEFSSMPATSRHHWGTDFDFNDLNNAWFDAGEGKAVHDWLTAHGAEYGFCQVYSPRGPERPNGYEEERWHWSYIPIAGDWLAKYPAVVGYDHIAGFEGAGTARDIDVIANYVEGINPACR
ncbi:MAG: M15 family metallopeptidase [Hyphomonadaceae bacterium]